MLLQRDGSMAARIAALMVPFLFLPLLAHAQSSSRDRARLREMQNSAMQLAKSIGIADPIQVVVVPRNDLVISVELLPKSKGYGILIDRLFLEQLTSDEVIAALAHELGHVWIYSHHPFLQTEALANNVAMRVVSRGQLEAVYVKLWGYTGVKGNIEELLGGAPAIATK